MKTGPLNPSRDRGGEDAGGVFAGPLLGVADLGARDLEDERADVVPHGHAEERARGVVGQRADVERGNGEGAIDLAPSEGHVERIDRRGDRAAAPRFHVNGPARVGFRVAVAEDGGVNELVDIDVVRCIAMGVASGAAL